jgi:hypothetical protein
MNILPLMAELGRNSTLTRKIELTLKEKLTPMELRNFHEWLMIVRTDRDIASRSAVKRAGRW